MVLTDSTMEALRRSMLKIGMLQQVPEGLCSHCSGTGQGEEIADLGEARWNGATFAIKACRSCHGTGMVSSQTRVTRCGILLGVLVLAFTWPLEGNIRWTGVGLVACAFALVVILSLHNRKRSYAPSIPPVEGCQIGYGPDLTTDGILSLMQVHKKVSGVLRHPETDSDAASNASTSGSESIRLNLK
jgi:hypothetical protein